MKKVELYHGSEKIIEAPVFGAGNPHNDYGLGFYCTQSAEMAREWACGQRRDGFANRYTIDIESLSALKLTAPDYHILNWMAVLLENRTFETKTPVAHQAKDYILANFLPDYRKYDIIIGYRADDSYFSFSRAFLENGISLEQLQRAMRLGGLGEQVVLKSEAAFGKIRFEGAETVDGSIYYARRIFRDRQARESYIKLQAESAATDAVYAVDILREKWQNNDERLY